MDVEYMRSMYHRTHYEFFFRALPMFLKSEILDQILEGARQGIGNQYLVGFWRGTAKSIAGLSIDSPTPREVDFTRDDFTMAIMHPAQGMTLLLMTGPPPRGPVEAGCSVAIFQDARPIETMRYFTSESPMEPSFPWMVGEWFDNGGRANLGGISDVSAQGMINFVLNVVGLPLQELPKTANTSPASASVSRNFTLSFSAKWTSSAIQLANETVEALYGLRAAGGTALVLNAKKTRGLGKKTSSYVQFKWNEDGSLIVEVQGDYSYWGLSVPSNQWPVMQACGLMLPHEGSGNFGLLIPSQATMQDQTQVLQGVFQAFIDVLQPDGKISEMHF